VTSKTMDKIRDWLTNSRPSKVGWVFTGTEVKERYFHQYTPNGKPTGFWETTNTDGHYLNKKYKTEKIFDTEEEAIRHGIETIDEDVDRLNHIKEKLEDRSLELICQIKQK